MKIADEFTSPPIPNDTPRLIIAYALIVLVVIILIGLGIFIYNEVQKEKSYAEGINKVQNLPIQAESNPYRNVKLNKELQVDNDKLEYKQYEMQHHRPDTFNLKYYTNYLPKNYQRKTINDIKEIFNSKFLYIENKKITFDYIYTIRKKDLENNDIKNKTHDEIEIIYTNQPQNKYKNNEYHERNNRNNNYQRGRGRGRGRWRGKNFRVDGKNVQLIKQEFNKYEPEEDSEDEKEKDSIKDNYVISISNILELIKKYIIERIKSKKMKIKLKWKILIKKVKIIILTIVISIILM